MGLFCTNFDLKKQECIKMLFVLNAELFSASLKSVPQAGVPALLLVQGALDWPSWLGFCYQTCSVSGPKSPRWPEPLSCSVHPGKGLYLPLLPKRSEAPSIALTGGAGALCPSPGGFGTVLDLGDSGHYGLSLSFSGYPK